MDWSSFWQNSRRFVPSFANFHPMMARTLSVRPEEVKMSTRTLIRWTYSTNQYSPSVSSERTSTVCDIQVKREAIALLRETVGLTICVGQPLHIFSTISSFRSIPNLRKYRAILSMKFKYNNNGCNHGRDAINASLYVLFVQSYAA